jgi:hypothetical protein
VRGNATYRKKARLLGVPYQHIDRWMVFERDNWTCQSCGKILKRMTKAELLKAWGENDSPELGHILPMNAAWRGPHTYENVECQCRACNGAQSGAQSGLLSELYKAAPKLAGMSESELDAFRLQVSRAGRILQKTVEQPEPKGTDSYNTDLTAQEALYRSMTSQLTSVLAVQQARSVTCCDDPMLSTPPSKQHVVHTVPVLVSI